MPNVLKRTRVLSGVPASESLGVILKIASPALLARSADRFQRMDDAYESENIPDVFPITVAGVYTTPPSREYAASKASIFRSESVNE